MKTIKIEVAENEVIQVEAFLAGLRTTKLEPERIPWDYETWRKDPKMWRVFDGNDLEVTQLTEFEASVFPLFGVVGEWPKIYKRDGCFMEGKLTFRDLTSMERIQP